MIKDKDNEILGHLRKNARKKITEISNELEIPVTTIYDRLKSHNRNGLIKKHVTLIDFSKLGYNSVALLALKVSAGKREELKEFLSGHHNVNSLYRVNFQHDFLAEVVFENVSKLQDFIDLLIFKFGIEKPGLFNIVSEIHREKFLTKG